MLNIEDSQAISTQPDTSKWIENPLEATALFIGVTVEEILKMEQDIIQKVNALPPIPKTVLEIEQLKSSPDKDLDKLLKIIESDPMITANILKISNSALYGFSGKIKTVKIALSMLWFNMGASIAMSSAINNLLKPNLTPYEVNIENFTHISSIQSKIIAEWKDPKIKAIKNDLQIAAFLQEVGKIIISMVLIEKKLVYQFQRKLEWWADISYLEEKTVYKTSAEITAMIFKHWKLNPKMISLIEFSDKPENAPEEFKVWAMALKIVKTLSPVFKESLWEKDLIKALKLILNYGFDWNYITKVIETIDESYDFEWKNLKTLNTLNNTYYFDWDKIRKMVDDFNEKKEAN